MNYEHEDLMPVLRTPQPPEPSAERLARERQQVFHSFEPGEVPHEDPPGELTIHRAEICVLDERGGHRQLGVHCPHFEGFDPDEVIEVDF